MLGGHSMVIFAGQEKHSWMNYLLWMGGWRSYMYTYLMDADIYIYIHIEEKERKCMVDMGASHVICDCTFIMHIVCPPFTRYLHLL